MPAIHFYWRKGGNYNWSVALYGRGLVIKNGASSRARALKPCDFVGDFWGLIHSIRQVVGTGLGWQFCVAVCHVLPILASELETWRDWGVGGGCCLLLMVPWLTRRGCLMWCPSDCVYIERCTSKVVLPNPIEASLCVWRGHYSFYVVWQKVINPRNLWRMLAILINSN